MLSLGEKRVRTDFTVSKSTKVSELKNTFADIINALESEKESHFKEGTLNTERERLFDLAQQAVECAAMWSVKSMT